jgi:hypothetical protein
MLPKTTPARLCPFNYARRWWAFAIRRRRRSEGGRQAALAVLAKPPGPAVRRPAAHSKRTGQAIGANRMRPPVGIDREPGCRRDERRLNAQDRTFDGKMPGKALVRRAIDCRFLFALSSCQLDMWRTLVASSVPPNL